MEEGLTEAVAGARNFWVEKRRYLQLPHMRNLEGMVAGGLLSWQVICD
jgi:hypothetical protein